MFDFLKLSPELQGTLETIYRQTVVYRPHLSSEEFIQIIIKDWLNSYRTRSIDGLQRNNVKLKNNLKSILTLRGKSQRQLARETGLNVSYLSGLINGKYEPSITVAYLIANALGYGPSRIGELFWLELADEV